MTTVYAKRHCCYKPTLPGTLVQRNVVVKYLWAQQQISQRCEIRINHSIIFLQNTNEQLALVISPSPSTPRFKSKANTYSICVPSFQQANTVHIKVTLSFLCTILDCLILLSLTNFSLIFRAFAIYSWTRFCSSFSPFSFPQDPLSMFLARFLTTYFKALFMFPLHLSLR